MAKASQAVILENEFYIIKAPNGKVLEVKNFNTENGAAIQLWSYAGYVRLTSIDVQLRTSEHRSMYSYVRLSIDRCTATYV